jgi:hypothetical protein
LRSFRPSLFLSAVPLFTPALQAQFSEISTRTLVACNPVAERTGDQGCWILASQPLGTLDSAQIYWTLDTFPGRAAAEKAKAESKTKNATGLESPGQSGSSPSAQNLR